MAYNAVKERSERAMQECRLEVEPREFAKALKILTRVESKEQWAQFGFDGRDLTMQLGETQQRIPASGSWPDLLHFRSRFARALAERPMHGSPLELSVEADRLTVGTFTFPCTAGPVMEDAGMDARSSQIAEAARILKKLRVTQETVEKLVANANPAYARLWSDAYGPMIGIVANAWKLLGPLGVDPLEIRRAIEDSVRYAFSGGSSDKATAGRSVER